MALTFVGFVMWILASSSFGGGLAVPLYWVEGYLDQAPAGIETVEQIEVTARGRARTLLVVGSHAYGLGRPLDVKLGGDVSAFELRGRAVDLDRLQLAANGTAVKGVFMRSALARQLVIRHLELAEPGAGTS